MIEMKITIPKMSKAVALTNNMKGCLNGIKSARHRVSIQEWRL